MNRHSFLRCALLAGCFTFSYATVRGQEAKPVVGYQRIYPELKLARPTLLLTMPDKARLLVDQRGTVFRLSQSEQAAGDSTVFLDLKERKLEADQGSAFEEGLVGMALHPKFEQNRRFFVFYTLQDPKVGILSEMTTPAGDLTKADPASEKVLLRIPLPHWNHHGGNLIFGPDGLLYLGMGDGGGPQGGDPHNFSQNTFSLLGKMLRLDVDSTTGSRPYGIPAENPWKNKAGYYPEPVALGIRNPWGMAFDADGTLWFADVGQNGQEEVNILSIGGNYGWNFREGTAAFVRSPGEPPKDRKFIEPIATYGRDLGISITGGVFYKGEALPQLKGAFIYGDWGSGRIWALRYDKAASKVVSNDLLLQPASTAGKAELVKPSGFSLDEKGEVIVLDWNGTVQRMVPAGG